VDEAVQYLYTVLSSVPNVLLIAACVLMVQVFLDQHPELFETGAERADLKLFLLCAVLGLTGWAGLCRLMRAETLKQRELDYVRAAHAFGVGHARIMWRHIFPNVAHLMLIVTVLEFSRGRGLVHEQLRRHDQPRPQRNEPRPPGLVVLRRRLRLHVHHRAGRQPVGRWGAEGL
jgi:ABC-type dipeptide/oligopeptide/nickel transport system permease subunit